MILASHTDHLMSITLADYERQWWQLDRLKGADTEHRQIVLKFYKAPLLENPPNPLLHGRNPVRMCISPRSTASLHSQNCVKSP